MSAPDSALLLVRNTFSHDARVLRAASALRDRGLHPRVVAVMSTTERRAHDSQQGVDVLRLDPRSPFGLARRWQRRIRKKGERYGRPSSPHGDSPHPGRPGPVVKVHRLCRTADFYRRALGVVHRERPLLLHCNDYNTMWVGVLSRFVGRPAVVYDSHELWPDRNLRPEVRWWLIACEALFVRSADVVMASSLGHAAVMAERYSIPVPAVVRNIPDAVPPGADVAAPRDPGLAIYVGGLMPHRGIEETIRALSHAPDIRLRLLGPGREDYREHIRGVAASIGVTDRVEIAPPVAPKDVVDALRGAAFGIALFQPTCLSHRLVAPNKVFEYLTAGLPSLVSDLPVMREFIQAYGVGVTADATDPEKIAGGLRRLADPAENRLLRQAAKHAAQQVNWEREREILQSVYAAALARR